MMRWPEPVEVTVVRHDAPLVQPVVVGACTLVNVAKPGLAVNKTNSSPSKKWQRILSDLRFRFAFSHFGFAFLAPLRR